MHDLNNYEVWKQRTRELRREAEMSRLAKAARKQQYWWLTLFWWEFRRDFGRLYELFRRRTGCENRIKKQP